MASTIRKRPVVIPPPAGFLRDIRIVVAKILLFIVVYWVILLASVGLFAFSVLAGMALVMMAPNFITIAVALGIIAAGVMFMIFMVKFIFRVDRHVDPIRIQLSAKEQPRLFEVVQRIADGAGAPFPKKIFLVPDVNASVNYDSSFWSMFLPVRKNLSIGLGLVNCLTVTELEAVIAHEFGHFGQRSMKLTSYVYTVNRTLHDLVFEEDKWDSAVRGWANIGGIFGLFAVATSWLVQGVRWIFVQVYRLINLSYLKVSRGMEFHADLVAGMLTGRSPLISALRRTNIANEAYEYTLGHLGAWANEGMRTLDVYNDHRTCMAFLVDGDKSCTGHFDMKKLARAAEGLKGDETARLVIKDQWASHPTLEEREANMAVVPMTEESDDRSAWELFTDADELRQRMSAELYRGHTNFNEMGPIPIGAFRERMATRRENVLVDPRFNGYFDHRFLTFEGNAPLTEIDEDGIRKLFEDEHARRIRRSRTCENELATLRAIANKELLIKHFEFDGVRYTRKEAGRIADQLDQELKDLKLSMTQGDLALVHFIRASAPERSELSEALQALQEVQHAFKRMETVMDRGQELYASLRSKPEFTEAEMRGHASDNAVLEARFRHMLEDVDMEKFAGPDHKETMDALKKFIGLTSRAQLDEFQSDYYVHIMDLLSGCMGALDDRRLRCVRNMSDLLAEQIFKVNEEAEVLPSPIA